ncbi:hypothetical protein GCM10022226_00910 [Sphaerisporangium flaviroseum]|uniref:Secreted protein n=1 Tax=Sphaerisporangium flaviroseum TaxID=509199 RepID=A0ABP7HE59_9ACTN
MYPLPHTPAWEPSVLVTALVVVLVGWGDQSMSEPSQALVTCRTWMPAPTVGPQEGASTLRSTSWAAVTTEGRPVVLNRR